MAQGKQQDRAAEEQAKARAEETQREVEAAERAEADAHAREQVSANPDEDYVAANTGDPAREVRAGADPEQAAPTTAVGRVPAASGQAAQEATTGLGLYSSADGEEKIDVTTLGEGGSVSTMRMPHNVYEEFVLPTSNPRDPRTARRLVFRKGQDVPITQVRALQRRFAGTESKEGQGAAPENKGPSGVEVK